MTARDYSTVTEMPGDGVSREAAAMMRERYAITVRQATGRDVLEISCGTGQGLGWLASHARCVVGADITFGSLGKARQHYGGRIPLLQCDAHSLPFVDGSFDVVAIHEAIYYYRDVDASLAECRRVLRLGGTLIISTINPEWPDFNPSPFSSMYLPAPELSMTLQRHFDEVRIFLAFPAQAKGLRGEALSLLKRWAVALGLIPKTMKGKRFLKRLVFGELESVPRELAGGDPTFSAVPLDGGAWDPRTFKVIYALAERS